jgi:hypothetical protein
MPVRIAIALLVALVLTIACGKAGPTWPASVGSPTLLEEHRTFCLPRGYGYAGFREAGTPFVLREQQPEDPAAFVTPGWRVVECGADQQACPCSPGEQGPWAP